MKTERLERMLGMLKAEFFAAGDQWVETRNADLLNDLHALVAAINQLEEYMYDKRITTLLDIV